MTRDECLDRIAELKASNEQLRAEREARQLARDADLFAYDDYLRAERSAEPERSPYVQRDTGRGGLVYRRLDNALQPVPEPAPDWSAWERWLQAHLDNLREQMAAALGKATMALLQEERSRFEREIAILKNENSEIRGMLGAALQLLGQQKSLWKPGDA